MPNSTLSAAGQPLPNRWLAQIVCIWGGQAASMLTSYAAAFAAVWYVTETSGSALMLALTGICAYLPTGLLAPFGGVLADRANRKVLLIAADMSIGVLSLILALAIIAGQASAWLVMAMVAARSVGQAFHSPAMMAVMPSLVPDRHLLRINALDQTLLSVAGIVSPAIGILLYENVGFHSVMLLDFLGAILACLGLAVAKIPDARQTAVQTDRHPLHDLKEGWRALSTDRGLFRLTVLVTLAMVAFGPMSSLYPLMTYGHFGGDGYAASVVESVFAAGMLAGSALVMIWPPKRLALMVAIACSAFGALSSASGLLPSSMLWAFAILCAFMGMVCAWFNAPMVTLFQRNVPNEAIGRALGFFTAAMGLASPAGIMVGGVVAEEIGVPAFFVIDGILCVLIGIAMYAQRCVRLLDETNGAPGDKA